MLQMHILDDESAGDWVVHPQSRGPCRSSHPSQAHPPRTQPSLPQGADWDRERKLEEPPAGLGQIGQPREAQCQMVRSYDYVRMLCWLFS